MAITWQNVHSPNNTGILSVMQDQPRIINQSVNDLANVINDVGVKQDDAKVQNLLNKLQSFKTVDEVKAFEGSDEYAQLTSGIVRNENQAKVRGSTDARAQGLREMITNENSFTDGQATRDFNNTKLGFTRPAELVNAEANAALAPKLNQIAAVNAETGFKEALFKEQNIDQTQSDALAKSTNSRLSTEAEAVTLKETAANKPYVDQFNAALNGKDYESAKTVIDSLQGAAKGAAIAALNNAQVADAATQRELAARQQGDLAANESGIVDLNNKIATIKESTIGSQTGQAAVAKLTAGDAKKGAAIAELLVKYPALNDLPIAKALAVVQKNMAGFDEWFTRDSTVQAKIKSDLDSELELNKPFIDANKSSLAQYSQGLERLQKDGNRLYEMYNPGAAAQKAAYIANQDLVAKQTADAKASLKMNAEPTKAVLDQREAETRAQLDIALVESGQKKTLSPTTIKFRAEAGKKTVDSLFGAPTSGGMFGDVINNNSTKSDASQKIIDKLQKELKTIEAAKKSK